jgi:hypothetical protein
MEVGESEDAQAATQLQQAVEDLGAGLGVLQGPVGGLDPGAEELGQGLEPDVGDILRHDPASQPSRAHRRAGDGLVAHPGQIVVQEPEVEGGVVRHEHRAAQELHQGGERRLDGGGAAEQDLVDPGQMGDEPGNGDPWVDQGVEGAEPFAAPVLDRADLGDPGLWRGAARGLQVHAGEGDLAEWYSQVFERRLHGRNRRPPR